MKAAPSFIQALPLDKANAAGLVPGEMSPAARRKREIAKERIRLFFLQDAKQAIFGIRYLHFLSLLGAGFVGFVTWVMAGTSVGNIAIWFAIVFVSEAATTIVNQAFQRRAFVSLRLRHWAWAKTLAIGCNGVAWSFGPIFLHVDGVPISVLAPVWGILNIMSAAVASGALYAPSMIALVVGASAPVTLWLASFGGGLELAVSVCIGLSLPFVITIGIFSVSEAGEAIEARLKISELLEIQTRQTEQIRAAHQERNRFFSAASHDLRQPLHAMGFYLSLMSRIDDAAELAEIVSRLSECASGLDRQFNAILGVAETDTAFETAILRPIALQDVINRAVTNFQPEAVGRAIALRIVPTTLWAHVVPDMLERILSNLLSNAIKYTPAGTVLVGVRRRGSFADLMVVDTGIGIDAAHLPLIFEDFFQIANSERNREKGFGLGLGIVRRLCDGMSWPLEVKSLVGRGTTFAVRVPLLSGDDMMSVSAPSPDVSADGDLVEGPDAKGRVLVIDDDPLVRDSVRRLLVEWHFEVHVGETGPDAVAILSESAPDVRWHVLLDYRLAGEDGLLVADRLMSRFADRIHITIMSGESNVALVQAARERGIMLLRKPVKPISLRAALTSRPSLDDDDAQATTPET